MLPFSFDRDRVSRIDRYSTVRDALTVKGPAVRKTLFASLLLAPSLPLASGYAVPNSHPRDLGVCASGVAAQSDAAAAFALPAALARISGPSIRLGGGVVTVGADWTDPTPGATQPPFTTFAPPTPGAPEPGTASLDSGYTAFPTVAASYGGKLAFLGDRGWGVGIALQPFGGSILTWPDDWAGRYRITEVDRRVFSGILSAGIEVIPQIRVGGGLVYYYTTEKFTQKLWQEPFGPAGTPTPGYPDATAKLDLDGGAFTYDVSLEIDPVKGLPLTIAVDYKHKATQDLDGSVTWSGVAPVLSAPVLPPALAPLKAATSATSAKQQLTIPNTLNIGAAYRVSKPVLVTATFTQDRWVVYDQDHFVANTGFTITVPRHYGNGQTYRAGVNWDVLTALTVRAGVQRDIPGLKEEFYSPTLPDASSWGGSLGATYRFAGGFSVDAAAFYANMDKVTVPSSAVGSEPHLNAPPAPPSILPTGTFRGSYEPDAWILTASVNWQPGAK
jgi:long-chain fatty acid transport protein